MASLKQIQAQMCVFSFVMMFRFFKAFRANPRLAIAVNTLVKAAVDILHFFVVFLTIFLVFTLMAYITFGAQLSRLVWGLHVVMDPCSHKVMRI